MYDIHSEKQSYRIENFFAVDETQVQVDIPWGKDHPPTLSDCLNATSPSLERPVFVCIGADGYCFNNAERRSVPKKNATSAIFAMGWSGSNQICYYAAGDGNRAIEKTFAAGKIFLQGAQGNDSLGTLVAKGTHHGALTAFVEAYFKEMKPGNYFVSAGKRHGHPRKFMQGV